MKITLLPSIVILLASVLIIPIGISYATYGDSSAFTTGAPTTSPVANPTMTSDTNQTSMHPAMNQTMTSDTNQTSMHPAMNQTMTSDTNQTSMHPAMNQTMAPTTPPVMSKSSMLSPLQQVKSGVAPKDVQCKAGLSLIFKAEDGSPACVNPDVATILAQRGW